MVLRGLLEATLKANVVLENDAKREFCNIITGELILVNRGVLTQPFDERGNNLLHFAAVWGSVQIATYKKTICFRASVPVRLRKGLRPRSVLHGHALLNSEIWFYPNNSS